MTRISQRHFRILSLVCRGRLIYDCCADNSSWYVVAWAANAIKCNFARVCLQAQQLQAQSSRSELQAVLQGSRAFDCDATRGLRCGTFGTIQRFRQQTPPRAAITSGARRSAANITAMAIATFRIITCPLSTRNTRATRALIVLGTRATYYHHCRSTVVNILCTAPRFLDLWLSPRGKTKPSAVSLQIPSQLAFRSLASTMDSLNLLEKLDRCSFRTLQFFDTFFFISRESSEM